MIELSRLGGQKFILNCDLIKMLESTPDTVITLTTGERMMVKDPVNEVIRKTMDYRWRLVNEPPQVRTP